MKDKNTIIYTKEVGRKLKDLRKEANMKQEDIAAPTLISSIERGGNLPGVITLNRYIKIFGLDKVANIFGWK